MEQKPSNDGTRGTSPLNRLVVPRSSSNASSPTSHQVNYPDYRLNPQEQSYFSTMSHPYPLPSYAPLRAPVNTPVNSPAASFPQATTSSRPPTTNPNSSPTAPPPPSTSTTPPSSPPIHITWTFPTANITSTTPPTRITTSTGYTYIRTASGTLTRITCTEGGSSTVHAPTESSIHPLPESIFLPHRSHSNVRAGQRTPPASPIPVTVGTTGDVSSSLILDVDHLGGGDEDGDWVHVAEDVRDDDDGAAAGAGEVFLDSEDEAEFRRCVGRGREGKRAVKIG